MEARSSEYELQLARFRQEQPEGWTLNEIKELSERVHMLKRFASHPLKRKNHHHFGFEQREDDSFAMTKIAAGIDAGTSSDCVFARGREHNGSKYFENP